MTAMDRLERAVKNGVQISAARRRGHDNTMWTIKLSNNKVVLTNGKVHKQAKLWLSWLTNDLKSKGKLGDKSSVSSSTIEVFVSAKKKWMSITDIPVRTPKDFADEMKSIVTKGDRVLRMKAFMSGLWLDK
jgi:hypothetical protein